MDLREEIADILDRVYMRGLEKSTKDFNYAESVDQIVSCLKTHNLVKVADNQEMPKYPYPLVTQIAGEWEIVDTWYKVFEEAQQDMWDDKFRRVELQRRHTEDDKQN